MPDPIEIVQMRQLIAEARAAFASDVDAVLEEMRTCGVSLGAAIGEVARQDAWHALRIFVLQKFDQRASLKNAEAEAMRPLLRFAFDYLTNADVRFDKVEFEAWKARAEPFIREGRG